MAEKIVQEWLNKYKQVKDNIQLIKDNIQLIKSIYDILQEPHPNLQEPVCGQLYEFYRSGHFELKRFCLQFVPAVVWNYLHGLATRKTCGRAESLLLGIYNMEAVEPDGVSRVETFMVPTLAKPSIYHEPVSQLALTENVLSYQQSDHHVVTRGPMSQLNELTIQKRFTVLTHVLSEYNNDIGFMSPVSHAFFCQICSRLVLCGFPKQQLTGKHKSHDEQVPRGRKLNLDHHNAPRIPLDSTFLLEMLTGIYFVMFNGQATAGMQAIHDIHFRASYELYADVLLVTNAIQHSLDTNPSGRPSDGPVGINVAVTPPSPVVKRSAITNASFKIRRQKETTITVTIEGVEKTDVAPSQPAQASIQDPKTAATVISVTSTKQTYNHNTNLVRGKRSGVSGYRSAAGTQDGVELEEVGGATDETGSDDQSRQHQDEIQILPASHVAQTSNSSGESIETNL